MLKNLTLPGKDADLRQRWQKVASLWPWALSFVCGLLFSRGVLLKELYPFGTGFAAGVCLAWPVWGLGAAIGAAAGFFTFMDWQQAAVYSLPPLCAYLFLCRMGGYQDKPFLAAAFAAAFHCLIRGAVLLMGQATIYQTVALLLESIFIFVLAVALWYSAQGFSQWRNHRQLGYESRCGSILLILGLLLGVEGMSFCGLGIQSMLCRYILMWAAYLGGPGAGAAAGVAMGLLPVFQGDLPLGSVTFYAAAGLLSGCFRLFRRVGVVVGFFLGNMMLAFYFSEPAVLLQSLMETSMAAAFFLLLPIGPLLQREEEKISLTFDSDGAEVVNQERLASLGEAFMEIQELMEDTEEEKGPEPEGDQLVESVCKRVCEGCNVWPVCWRENKMKTGITILNCGRRYHKQGMVNEKDLDPELLRRCPRSRELAGTIGCEVERFMMMSYYERRLSGSRNMVAQQLSGLGQLLHEMAEEVGEDSQICQESREVLEEELKAHGLPVQRVIIDNRQDRSQIKIVQEPCKDRQRCREQLLPLADKSLGLPHEIKELSCPVLGGNTCICAIAPKAVLDVEVGKAQCPKKGQTVSGDAAVSLQLPGRELALVVSDGMGSGPKAHSESDLALRLLERFLRTGLSAKMAVKTVNTAMVLRNNQDSFATLDLVIINQVSGRAEFIKAGGAPSLIWTKGDFQVITAGVPPAGILDQLEPQSFVKVLYPQDVVVTMSDGAWEALEGLEGRGNWLEELMRQLAMEEPDKIAEYLLYLAKNGKEEGGRDDMCVQVARVGKRNIA
ncbi:MAG: SpoIIE family protein phosphatase [Clostridiales bacterium]